MSRPPRKLVKGPGPRPSSGPAKPPKGQTDLPAGEGQLPSKAQVLAFIEQAPGKVGKREIARAFGVRGNDKIGLKRLIATLGQDGALSGNR